MRRFLSLFMVVLLALRGLAGDAMAMEQSANPAQHTGHAPAPAQVWDQQVLVDLATMTADAHHGHAEMPADAQSHLQHLHHDQATTHPDQTSSAKATTCSAHVADSDCHQHEGHCTACGICHSTLANPDLLALSLPLPQAALPAAGAARFASAATAELVKPPISAL